MGQTSSPNFSWRLTALLAGLALLAASPNASTAQASDPHATELIQAAVNTEIAAAKNDHNNWTYLDHDTTPDKNGLYKVVETPAGSLRRMVEQDGKPVSAAERQTETDRLAQYVQDASEQAKHKKASQHDDNEAENMLRILPHAFIWTVQSETPLETTLNFRPDPSFKPASIEERVMGTMAGDAIITHKGDRIRIFRGHLTQDVKIGYGLVGKLRQGGTFDVERHEVAPGLWEITDSRVHIDGRALLFKTIGQQEDEIKTDFHLSPAHTLRDAQEILDK